MISTASHLSTGARFTIHVLKVLIEPKRGACQPGYFECEGQKKICIATRYRCDRRQDCPNGDDESDKYCGYDPCKGKIICPELDNRCIEPQEYCCDPATDPNCEFTYSCCEALLEFSLGTRLLVVDQMFLHSSSYPSSTLLWSS